MITRNKLARLSMTLVLTSASALSMHAHAGLLGGGGALGGGLAGDFGQRTFEGSGSLAGRADIGRPIAGRGVRDAVEQGVNGAKDRAAAKGEGAEQSMTSSSANAMGEAGASMNRSSGIAGNGAALGSAMTRGAAASGQGSAMGALGNMPKPSTSDAVPAGATPPATTPAATPAPATGTAAAPQRTPATAGGGVSSSARAGRTQGQADVSGQASRGDRSAQARSEGHVSVER